MKLFDSLRNSKNQRKAGNTSRMKKNELKVQLDSIQNEIFQFLKPIGFKKKGRTFNRQTEIGIYQVINIQSGRYEFGEKYVIPGYRENYYGMFTVNLGVMVQDIYKLEGYNKPKDIYQDYDCQIRTRLPHLTINQDYWWSIEDDNEKIVKEIIEGLEKFGLKWFDNFKSREKIIKNWGDMATTNSPRAKLDVALIVLQIDREKGRSLMQDYYDKIENHGHKGYVKGLADKLGIELLNLK
jgi:hypothetical protein